MKLRIFVSLFVTSMLVVSRLTAQTNQSLSFAILNDGTEAFTSGMAGSELNIGFARVLTSVPNTPVPPGFADIQFRAQNTLVSETAIPATKLLSSTQFFVEVGGAVNTGIAIANPNSTPATVSFGFQDPQIRPRPGLVSTGTLIIPANSRFAGFINENPFNIPQPYIGFMSITSSIPVAMVALHGVTNERGEFLFAPLVSTDPPVQRSRLSTEAVVGNIPLLVDGGGWSTEFTVTNNDFQEIASGSLEFFDQTGAPLSVTIDGQSTSTATFILDRRNFRKFATSGSGTSVHVGSVQVTAARGPQAFDVVATYTFRREGVIVSIASLPMVTSNQNFRLYVEESGTAPEQLRTGVAIANASAAEATVAIELLDENGQSTGLADSITVPGHGEISRFFTELPGMASVQAPFRGSLRISTNNPDGVSVAAIRGRSNSRADFLMSALLPLAGNSTEVINTEMLFAHVVEGGGYNTELVLLNNSTSATGTMMFVTPSGIPFCFSPK